MRNCTCDNCGKMINQNVSQSLFIGDTEFVFCNECAKNGISNECLKIFQEELEKQAICEIIRYPRGGTQNA